MYNVLALTLLAALSAALFFLRKRLGLFASASLFFVTIVLWVKFGLSPRAPASVVALYVGVAIIVMAMYLTSSDERRNAFWAPVHRVLVERRLRPVLYALLLVVPALAAGATLKLALPSSDPPPRIRSVHPAPPGSIRLRPAQGEGRSVNLATEDSPYARIPDGERRRRIAHGREVYYQNCFFCHGDNLSADGHLAPALRPPPANFTEPGIIPMLQSSFLFWRIAKGGPGLPDEGTPWDSAMSAWEKFLSEEDIWSVVLFLSDFTGFEPRSKEHAE